MGKSTDNIAKDRSSHRDKTNVDDRTVQALEDIADALEAIRTELVEIVIILNSKKDIHI